MMAIIVYILLRRIENIISKINKIFDCAEVTERGLILNAPIKVTKGFVSGVIRRKGNLWYINPTWSRYREWIPKVTFIPIENQKITKELTIDEYTNEFKVLKREDEISFLIPGWRLEEPGLKVLKRDIIFVTILKPMEL